MSKIKNNKPRTKSIRQQQILDVAAENPDATLAEIAEKVASATPDCVDRVLEQYGDPGGGEGVKTDTAVDGGTDEQHVDSGADSGKQDDETQKAQPDAQRTESDTGDDRGIAPTEVLKNTNVEDISIGTSSIENNSTDSTMDEGTPPISIPDDVTRKEYRTLRVIHRQPEATQQAVADELEVSRATVSNRVNDIPGFDWADRKAFVEALFDEDSDPPDASTPDGENGVAATDGSGSERRETRSTADRTPDSDPERPAEISGGAGRDTTDGVQNATSANMTDGVQNTTDGVQNTTDSVQDAADDTASDDTDTADTTADNRSDDVARPDSDGEQQDRAPPSETLEELSERLAVIEREITAPADTEEPDDAPLGNCDLTHKVVHACLRSENISEEEELRILKEVIE